MYDQDGSTGGRVSFQAFLIERFLYTWPRLLSRSTRVQNFTRTVAKSAPNEQIGTKPQGESYGPSLLRHGYIGRQAGTFCTGAPRTFPRTNPTVPAAIPWDMSDQGDMALATPSAASFARRTPILRK